MISFSIFIASRIRRTSPSLTACPAVATTSHIVPGIGEEITVEPADGTAAGAGAAAATGAAADACTVAGADVATPPASSTSTAYVVPFTEILYFFIIYLLY